MNSTTFFDFLSIDLVPDNSSLLDQWEHYKEIVQPYKASFWVMLGCFFFFIAWIIFLLFYLSRIVGPIVSFLLTRFIRLKGYSGHITLGSFSLSVLSGKVMFRSFKYICEDFSVRCNDGWIIFSYWRFVSLKPIPNPSDTSRLHISLNGLQIYLYNRRTVYRDLMKSLGFDRFLNMMKEVSGGSSIKRLASKEDERYWDLYYDKLWSLIGYIRLDIGSGRLVAGNITLPSVAVLTFENYASKVALKSFPGGADRALLTVTADVENVRISLIKSPGFEFDSHLPFVGRCDSPPRTMGDGFAVLQTAHLQFFYNQSILGIVKGEVQELDVDPPVWESVWRLGKNTVISYGPWADAQRVLLYNFFFPPHHGITEVTQMPKNGQRRILLAHDCRASLINDACLDLWFMRDEEVNALNLRMKPGSSFDFKLPWVINSEGFSSVFHCCMLFVESSTTLVYRKFFECETLRLTVSADFPRIFNAAQKWSYNLEINKIRAWIAWDHKRFFTDLVCEWTSDSIPDLNSFIPCTWEFMIKITDSFELILPLNDKNWIDSSSSANAENILAAISGESITASFSLPFIDFTPETVNLIYEIEVRNSLALRVWMPPQTVLSSLLHSLVRNSQFKMRAPPCSYKKTVCGSFEDWVEIWRTEYIKLLFEYTYHPIYCDIVSDIPQNILSHFLPERASHPYELEPDELLIEIVIGSSEVLVSGYMIRFIIDLKDNYFGLYDQLTDVSSRDNPAMSYHVCGNEMRGVEPYRPLVTKLCLRLYNGRGHCLVPHRISSEQKNDDCPILYVEQLVVELNKCPSETMIQVYLDSAAVFFEGMNSRNSASNTKGMLSLNVLSFRGHAMFSELDVPWDAGSIEYAWLMEVIVGQFGGNITPAQALTVAQITESILLLTLSPDDELELPERYDLCVHMTNLRTCARSPLNLIDKRGRVRNCETVDKLKYKSVRISLDLLDLTLSQELSLLHLSIRPLRISSCNGHDGTYRTAVHVRLPSLVLKQFAQPPDAQISSDWIECGSFILRDLDVIISLPCSVEARHILQERKNFWLKHDKASSRLYFLYSNENTCSCHGSSRFFGVKDLTGTFFDCDIETNLSELQTMSNEGLQPAVAESIVCQGENVLVYADYPVYGQENSTSSVNECEKPSKRSGHSSTESFHSAISTSQVSLSHHMVCPILHSPLLMTGYSTFLSSSLISQHASSLEPPVFHERNDLTGWIEKSQVVYKENRVGINGVKLTLDTQKLKSVPNSMNSSLDSSGPSSDIQQTRILADATDASFLCVNGAVGQFLEILVSPLALEASQHFVEDFAISLSSVSPVSIAQHIYAKCAFRRHKQPLIMPDADGSTKNEDDNVHLHVILPRIDLMFFQCGLIEKTIQAVSLQDSVSHLVRSSVILLTFPESTLYSSLTWTPNAELKLCSELRVAHVHGQFLQLVEASKKDFTNKGATTRYSTNWQTLTSLNHLASYDLRAVIDIDITDISCLTKPSSPSSPSRKPTNNLTFSVGSTLGTVGLCKPIEQTSSKEWPLFDVFAPCVAAWTHSLYRFEFALSDAKRTVREWIDLSLAKMMFVSLESKNDKILAAEKSCMTEVRVNYRCASLCPSCKLSVALLRYFASNNVDNWLNLNEITKAFFAGEGDRKEALIAVLSHWQTVLSPLMQSFDPEIAHNYLNRSPYSRELRVIVDADDGKAIAQHCDGGNTKSTTDSSEMDLYHWISARHKQHKEAISKLKGKVSRKPLANVMHVNAMEIVLPVFFWTYFKELQLNATCAENFPFPHLNLDFRFIWTDIRVDVLEPRMMISASLHYVSTVRHHLFYLESLDLGGHIATRVVLDEMMLKPFRIEVEASYTANIQSIRIMFGLASVCLFNDISRVIRSYGVTASHLQSATTSLVNDVQSTPVSTNISAFESEVIDASEKHWFQAFIEMWQDYLKSSPKCATLRADRGSISVAVKGKFGIKVVMSELSLTNLFVLMTVKKILVTHSNNRNRTNGGVIVVDSMNASLQRANLILSEFVVDAKHIVNFSVKESSVTYKRERERKKKARNNLMIMIGDIEGDMPIHAQNLHEVVMRNAPQLNAQMTRLEYSNPTPLGEYSPHLQSRHSVAVINFELILNSIELSAQLLPSLKVKYRLNGAESKGKTGSEAEFRAGIESHVVHFIIITSSDDKRASLASDTFTLSLPQISAVGGYKLSNGVEQTALRAENLQFREGGYIDVEVTIGKLEHMFTTQLLNQVLFAEQCFRSELSSLIDRLTTERPFPSREASGEPVPTRYPFLFSLKIRNESSPWLQLTASTPTSIAVRLTFDSIAATLTNRWALKDCKEKERLYGKVVIGMSAKLGQLVKAAMFEEIETELQEYASFMTQISAQNKDSNVHSSYSYVITVNRPFLFIKSTAIDKAILIWLDYKSTYDHCREERNKMLKAKVPSSSVGAISPLISESDVDVNLSLKVTNGLYVCIPLYSASLNIDSALIVSLQSTDITVCVRRELACQATFHNFRVQFNDNFDEQALSDSVLVTDAGDSTHPNFVFFPQGTYKFVSRATAAVHPSTNAKWLLSVKWQMLGMVIDLDQRIGRLASQFLSTFSSLTSGEGDDEWDESARESSVYSSNGDEDAEIDATGELGNIAQREERVQWLERKIHEQSVLVNDLIQCKVSEPAIEKERRKLRKLESARFKQFRKSMLEKLKRNANRQKKLVNDCKKSSGLITSRSSKDMDDSASDGPSSARENQKTHSRSSSNLSGRVRHITDPSSSSRSNVTSSGSVDRDIDVQITIETGQCILRAIAKPDASALSVASSLAKKPSARELKNKAVNSGGSIALTTLPIPSLSVKAYYSSFDTLRSHSPRRLREFLPHKFLKTFYYKRPIFYLSVDLASMPQESLVTPSLADFVEQLLEPLHEVGSATSSADLSLNVNTSDGNDSDVPIMEMDTSGLPLDVLLHLTVQSSTVRFVGQQQKSAAADCLLKLPSLTLMASTRPIIDTADGNSSVDSAGSGIHLFTTLAAFSLNIYSPHQQSTSHDALSLTLDHISFLISRSKNNRHEPDNKVQFVLTSNIGVANFNYDMRRLAELISFPKPWYRRAIVRRLFFGDQSMKVSESKQNSRVSTTKTSPRHQVVVPNGWNQNVQRKEWRATVLLAVEWKQLNVNAQMANTMGNTEWAVKEGVLRGFCQLNSDSERTVSATFRLKSSLLQASGGAISGQISISEFLINGRHQVVNKKPPKNSAKIIIEEAESRIEWMSRPILISRFEKPSICFSDEWATIRNERGEISRALVLVNVLVSFTDLELIITKVTVEDIGKIVGKLHSFFQEQLTSSRMVWGLNVKEEDDGERERKEREEGESPLHPKLSKYRHWPAVLDSLTEIQSRLEIFPLPMGSDGTSIVGGSVEVSSDVISLACMHGEMDATSWALFHMRQPSFLFIPEAQYMFITDAKDVGVSVFQKVTMKIGSTTSIQQSPSATECEAVVCRVQQSRGSMVRQNSSIAAYLDHVIGDALKQLGLHPLSPCQPTANHSVLKLFQFPALDAVLTSLQQQETDISESQLLVPEVKSSFVCEFHNAVCVQTDFSAQVSFLPELIKTYIKNQNGNKETKENDENYDYRKYICETWSVDPNIRFIDRFRWNPPVIDEILRILQIFDHRRTIPKALQRGMLDPCDAILARIVLAILYVAKKSCCGVSRSRKD